MTPGTVIFDREFPYHDEDKDDDHGRKLLIILNDGSSGQYIVIKTTSQPRHKLRKFGCQSADYYSNFYLPQGSCFLRKHTWLLLGKFYEFDLNYFLRGRVSGRMDVLGTLPSDILKPLLDCAIDCDDIETAYEQILIDTRNGLK